MGSIMDSQWYREFRSTGLPIQASVLIATIIVLTVIHRRFFSPISSIPGPFLASITRLWHLRQVASGKQNLKLIEQHEKHGMTAPSPADSASRCRYPISGSFIFTRSSPDRALRAHGAERSQHQLSGCCQGFALDYSTQGKQSRSYQTRVRKR